MVQQMRDFDETGQRRTGKHNGGIQQKYFLDQPGRNLLLAKYDGTTAVIDELALRLHVPRYVVKKWGQQLGLARQREPFWTKEDEQYLESNLHRTSIASIAQKLGRTKTAVTLKAKRIGANKTNEGYTMRGLCMGLGCDHHKVEKWLANGWIKGRRRQTERVNHDMWYFSDASIKKFVFAHPQEIDQRRVSWLWLIDVLSSSNSGQGIGMLSDERGEKE